MLYPLLTAKDSTSSSEGTLDPLGLYLIADALGVKMIPGIRERMSHPRFLTLTAVSAAVCADLDKDTLAADGVSTPQQVFEWYVVEGLVRGIHDDKRLSGLPGRDKADKAISSGLALSARTYLKTPSVFGYHGVYRLLAKSLDIEEDFRLGESGCNLLDVWRNEQGLPGFYETRQGKGSDLLKLWQNAVKDGLAKSCVARTKAWNGWRSIADHMGPHDAGPKELRLLASLIFDNPAGHTREVAKFIRSGAGKAAARVVLERRDKERIWSEHSFHAALRSSASASLRELLDAIRAYEAFARLLQGAFDQCLFTLSQTNARVSIMTLAKEPQVDSAARKAPDAFARAADALSPIGESPRFLATFQLMGERLVAADWAERLMEHHRKVQKAKPPNGKLPWVDRFDDGGYRVRPGFVREEKGRTDDSYVHAYRLKTLWSFASDMGRT